MHELTLLVADGLLELSTSITLARTVGSAPVTWQVEFGSLEKGYLKVRKC